MRRSRHRPRATEPPTDSTTTVTQPAATDGTAIVYASSGDESPWLPVGWWDGTEWGSVEWPTSDVVLPAATFDSVSVASVELEEGPLQGRDRLRRRRRTAASTSPGIPSITLDARPARASPTWWGYRAIGGDRRRLGRPAAPGAAPSASTIPSTSRWVNRWCPPTSLSIRRSATWSRCCVPTSTATGSRRCCSRSSTSTDSDGMPVRRATSRWSSPAIRTPDGTVVDEVLFEHVVPTPMDVPDVRPRAGARRSPT